MFYQNFWIWPFSVIKWCKNLIELWEKNGVFKNKNLNKVEKSNDEKKK